MNREEFAKKIKWPIVMFWLGLLNPVAFIPQIWSIATTHKVEGISIQMLVLFVIIQAAFFMNGFFQRDCSVMLSMGSSAVLTIVAIVLTFYYR